jgi:hypothetical protein
LPAHFLAENYSSLHKAKAIMREWRANATRNCAIAGGCVMFRDGTVLA